MDGISGIDGDPLSLLGFHTKTKLEVTPTEELAAGMDEGKYFGATDTRATKSLSTFVTAAAIGANAYNTTAKAAGKTYLTADTDGGKEIEGVTTLEKKLLGITKSREVWA